MPTETAPPEVVSVGHWVSETERIVELRKFGYGWRATLHDSDSDSVRHLKSNAKDTQAGLLVVGYRSVSLPEPATLPWPVDYPPVEELEAELKQGKPLVEVLAPDGEPIPEEPTPKLDATMAAAPVFDTGPIPPPPGPSGYQPAVGEGVTRIVATSGPDGLSVSATLEFPRPRAWADAQPAVADLIEALRLASPGNPEPVVQVEAPEQVDPAIGRKPSGDTFFYRPTTAVTTEQLQAGALSLVAGELPTDQLVVYDNRLDLEASPQATAWSIGAIKADPEGWLHARADDLDAGGAALATIGLDVDTMRHTVKLTKTGRAIAAGLDHQPGGVQA